MHVCLQTSGIIHQRPGVTRTTPVIFVSPSLPLRSVFTGVLWLCIVAETLYLTLLFTGGALMTLEQCPCFSIMNKLKLSAFAALCTALSGNALVLSVCHNVVRSCGQQGCCAMLEFGVSICF